EKYLKAFLLQHGWKLIKIHALHDLLSDAVVFKPELEEYRELCERVSGYYMIDRYPPLAPSEITCGDIEADIEKAKRLINIMFAGEPPAEESQTEK
ncbi:MAG: HEPN domain-containing protein, partial [Nitrospirae bacterium]|nr:HEPN domain-containing protein [Nitrospirota bacterium]